MPALGTAIRKLPPGAAIKVLKSGFLLPTPAARLVFRDVLRPTNSHKKYLKKVKWEENREWWGCWIGEGLKNLDDRALRRRIEDADIIFFNVHGGGFRIGKCTMFMDTYIQWLRVLKEKLHINALIMSVEHRLAPEYKYPSPVEDVVRAYEHLIRTLQVDASKVIAIGDSTGAALILEMLFITHDPSMFEIVTEDPTGQNAGQTTEVLSEMPRPASIILSSPLVTDDTTSESWQQNIKYDYITQTTARRIIEDYFEPLGPDAPPDSNQILGIAKLQSGFSSFLPPALMFVGNKEVLRDDALDFASKAEQDGVPWETIVEDCVHDWFCVREVVKDKSIVARADDIFADFCYRTVIAIRGKHGSVIPESLGGLEAVPEEEHSISEEDEDEFHEALTESSSEPNSSGTAVGDAPSFKNRSRIMTIYV